MEFPLWLSRLKHDRVYMRMWVWSLASLGGLRIWPCCKLWLRLQMWLGSTVDVAVVKAGSYSSNLDPNLQKFICYRWGPKKKKKKSRCQNLDIGDKLVSTWEQISCCIYPHKYSFGSYYYYYCYYCPFRAHPWHVEVPRLGVELKL